jgi:hypothetical protein
MNEVDDRYERCGGDTGEGVDGLAPSIGRSCGRANSELGEEDCRMIRRQRVLSRTSV